LFLTGDNDNQGNERADFFAHAFEKAGGKFVDRIMSEGDPRDIAGLLDKIKQSRPDFVFASFCGNSAVAFFQALHNESPPLQAPVIGPESLTSFPHNLQRIGKTAAGVKTLTTIRNPRELIDRIKAQLGHEIPDATKAAEGYDLAAVITEAVQKTKQEKNDPKKMIAFVKAMEIDGPRGKIRFDKNHEPILETMVQEWHSNAGTLTQKVIADLGPCKTPDFGCGRIGFPPKKGMELDSKSETDEAPE
jgi:ABC-type branched-subunit amino acid transport system substrate-binding protein